MAAVTLTEAKAHLNISTSSTADDTELAAFIDVAQALVEAEVGPLAATTCTDSFDGGTDLLLLTRGPVVSVTSVKVAGSTASSTSYDVAGQYLRSSAGPFGGGLGEVVVTYSAGHTSAAHLQLGRHATLELLRHLWATQRGTMAGRNPFSGDEAPASAGAGWSMPNRVRELLRPLRAPGVA